jgi:hypothetical protein
VSFDQAENGSSRAINIFNEEGEEKTESYIMVPLTGRYGLIYYCEFVNAGGAKGFWLYGGAAEHVRDVSVPQMPRDGEDRVHILVRRR